MKPEITTLDHDAAVRHLLVTTARRDHTARSRISPKTTAVGLGSAVAAFAIAGALTGGAVASASAPNAQQQTIDAANQAAGVAWVVEQDSKLLGQPFTASGTGKFSVNLGQRPAGANAVVEASSCSDPGTFNETVDGGDASQTICTASNGVGDIGSGDYNVSTGGKHTFTVTTTPGAHYSIWISWINYPSLSPSVAEKAAVADGVVSRDEYIAAFNQYLGCMASAGDPVTTYDDSSTLVQYTTPNSAVSDGTDHRCYQTQFRLVDELWNTEDGGIHQN